MFVYTRACVVTYVCVLMCLWRYVRMFVYSSVCEGTCVCVLTCLWMYACMCTQMFVLFIKVRMCVHTYVQVLTRYIHTYVCMCE